MAGEVDPLLMIVTTTLVVVMCLAAQTIKVRHDVQTMYMYCTLAQYAMLNLSFNERVHLSS